MSDCITSVAFLGTGLMGLPMAQRIASAGFSIRAWNRTSHKLAALAASGVEVVASPADAARGADVVCLCLADAAAIERVVFDADGVAATARSGQLVVDFSTIGPEAALRAASRLHATCGASWLDAPVSGGVGGAQSGQLVVFCGGAAEDLERARPLLAVLTRRITHVGAAGSGQMMKLCNQLIVATNLVAIAEALSLARVLGLDASCLPDALAGGFADSAPLQTFGRRMALGSITPVLGEIATMHKDIELVVETAHAMGSLAPVARAAAEIYRLATACGLGSHGLAALMNVHAAAERTGSCSISPQI